MLALRVWDALVVLLLLFPLLTGGVWIERHGSITAELSDLGIPVLLLAVLGAAIARATGRSLAESASYRWGARAWRAWSETLECGPWRALSAAAALVAALWSTVAIRRYYAFGSNEFDLGIFTNAMWNLIHGFGYVSAPKEGVNLFADHQSPVFWLFAPIFALAPRPETLLVAQAAVLAAGGFAAWALAAQYLPERHWGRAALPLLYWGFLPLRNANAFDFHPEVTMLPLYLAAIAGLQSRSARSRVLGALALLAALGGKESSGPVAAGVGLAWLLGAGPEATRSFTRKLGVAAIAAGMAVFWLDLKLVPRLVGARQYAYYEGFYNQFGGGLGDLALAPVLKPGLFWGSFIGKARRVFLFWTLAPLAFLPLLNWRSFAAALPGYLMLFLSAGDHRVNVGYHYAIEPGVGLFWAVPGAILAWERRGPPIARLRAAPRAWLWVLFWALAAHGRSEIFRIRHFHPTPHTEWARGELLPCLDRELPIAATSSWAPHVAARHWEHNVTSLAMPGGGRVACAIADTSLGIWPLEGGALAEAQRQWIAQGYAEAYRCGDVVVYEASEARGRCLSCKPACR